MPPPREAAIKLGPNITLVGYRHKALIGINVDAAAVPDLGALVACMREGFDVVIALGDEGQLE